MEPRCDLQKPAKQEVALAERIPPGPTKAYVLSVQQHLSNESDTVGVPPVSIVDSLTEGLQESLWG